MPGRETQEQPLALFPFSRYSPVHAISLPTLSTKTKQACAVAPIATLGSHHLLALLAIIQQRPALTWEALHKLARSQHPGPLPLFHLLNRGILPLTLAAAPSKVCFIAGSDIGKEFGIRKGFSNWASTCFGGVLSGVLQAGCLVVPRTHQLRGLLGTRLTYKRVFMERALFFSFGNTLAAGAMSDARHDPSLRNIGMLWLKTFLIQFPTVGVENESMGVMLGKRVHPSMEFYLKTLLCRALGKSLEFTTIVCLPAMYLNLVKTFTTITPNNTTTTTPQPSVPSGFYKGSLSFSLSTKENEGPKPGGKEF